MENKKKISSVKQLSNSVVNEQLRDIKLYTQGHLNEAHLYKLPEDAFHKPWESAMKPHVLLRPPQTFNKHSINEKLVTNMCDTLAEFSVGATFPSAKRSARLFTPSTDYKKDVYVEELKLPDIIVARKQTSISTPKPLSSFLQTPLPSRETRATKLLEQSTQKSTSNAPQSEQAGLPRTDIEIAYKIIHDPLSGATKQDKLNNLRRFEETVIQKSDLTNSNVLYDTKKIKELEEKLEKDLMKLNITSKGPNFHRLQVYNNVLMEIIMEKNIFGDLLDDIKKEYDLYLYYLLDRQANNGSELVHQADLVKTSGLNKISQIKETDKQIIELEKSIEEYALKNDEIKSKIDFEERFNAEKVREQEEYMMNELNAVATSNYNRQFSKNIFDRVEYTKETIIKKLKEVDSISENINNKYVPNVVINNLSQSIKDTDIEIQKLTKQSEFLSNQVERAENELKNILIKYDNSEFAEDNIQYLLKSIKNLEVLQFSNSDDRKSISVEKASRSNGSQQGEQQQQHDDYNGFLHKYDDYFS